VVAACAVTTQSTPGLAGHLRVIAADMPGWGESDSVAWQERDHSTALLDLMDALDLETETIIGNSMGGGTTLRFGYERPSSTPCARPRSSRTHGCT